MGATLGAERHKRDVSGVVRKQVATTFTPGAEPRSFVFVASDGSVDRMGDTINPEGWNLKSFRSNPVILFAHKQNELPIGKSLAEWVEGGSLRLKVQFTSADENPLGAQVQKLVEGRYLNAVSVGFHPTESKIAEDRDDGQSWFPPMDFTKQDLLETSVVPVPANANALLEAKAAGIDISFIADWAERVLCETKGVGIWIPRERLESVVLSAGPSKSFIDMGAKTVKSPEPPAPPAPVVIDQGALLRAAVAEEVAKRKALRTGKL